MDHRSNEPTDLLGAIRSWLALNAEIRQAEEAGVGEQVLEALCRMHSAAVRTIAATPSPSSILLAFKSYLLHQAEQGEMPEVPAGGIVVPEMVADGSEEAALRLGIINDVLRMFPALGRLSVGDATGLLEALAGRDIDDEDLDEAIAMLQAKAPSMIQIPSEPSETMLDAAARKAGISQDQAKEFYDNMISMFSERNAA